MMMICRILCDEGSGCNDVCVYSFFAVSFGRELARRVSRRDNLARKSGTFGRTVASSGGRHTDDVVASKKLLGVFFLFLRTHFCLLLLRAHARESCVRRTSPLFNLLNVFLIKITRLMDWILCRKSSKTAIHCRRCLARPAREVEHERCVCFAFGTSLQPLPRCDDVWKRPFHFRMRFSWCVDVLVGRHLARQPVGGVPHEASRGWLRVGTFKADVG